MHPLLFGIRGFKVHTYGVLIAIGVLLGIWVLRRGARAEGIDPEKVTDVAFWALLAALAGARVSFILLHWGEYAGEPLRALKFWEGGLVFYGGLIPGILVGVLTIRTKGLPVLKTMDLFAPSLALGHAIGRIGCFCAGCCYGSPTSLPWGVIFRDPQSLAPLGVRLHPTQLYSSLFLFGLFLFLLFLRRRKAFAGEVFWSYLLIYSAGRFLLEFLRGDPRAQLLWGLSHNQGVMVALFFLSLIMLRYSKKNA